MEIKKSDNKGRLTVGDDGQHYWVQRNEDGSILLNPLKLPEVPRLGREDMPAIYVHPARFGRDVDTVTIHARLGSNLVDMAEKVAELANSLELPVVVDATGLGVAVADVLQRTVALEVIETYAHSKHPSSNPA